MSDSHLRTPSDFVDAVEFKRINKNADYLPIDTFVN